MEDGTIVDGEVVAVDQQGRPAFNALQNSQRGSQPIFYYVFDLLEYRGKSLLELPLRERRELLDAVKLADPVRLSQPLTAQRGRPGPRRARAGARRTCRETGEQRLEPGARSGAWVKFKVNRGQELVVGGYLPGTPYFGSILVGYYEAGKLIFIAKVKNGFVPRTRKELLERMNALETPVCPFANLPEPKNARRGEALTAEVMKKCHWLKPELVAQIEYTEWTSANHLRHSRFAGLRDDKNAREVVREPAAGAV